MKYVNLIVFCLVLGLMLACTKKITPIEATKNIQSSVKFDLTNTYKSWDAAEQREFESIMIERALDPSISDALRIQFCEYLKRYGANISMVNKVLIDALEMTPKIEISSLIGPVSLVEINYILLRLQKQKLKSRLFLELRMAKWHEKSMPLVLKSINHSNPYLRGSAIIILAKTGIEDQFVEKAVTDSLIFEQDPRVLRSTLKAASIMAKEWEKPAILIDPLKKFSLNNKEKLFDRSVTILKILAKRFNKARKALKVIEKRT